LKAEQVNDVPGIAWGQVVVEHGADEKYPEAKVASVLSKRTRRPFFSFQELSFHHLFHNQIIAQ
jgi:ribonuclease HII